MSKAGKSSPSPTAGGPLFGSLPKTPGFLRRNRTSGGGKRDDDDAVGSLGTNSGGSVSTAGSAGSEEERVKSTGEKHISEKSAGKSRSSDTPFGTLSLQGALLLDSSEKPAAPSSDHEPEPEPDLSNAPRRGSEVSTSSFSIAPSSPGVNHRNSLSSFASSTGSPLATGSSGGTTIGDLSTMSMPLLRNGGEERYLWNGSQRSDGQSLAPSSSSRPANGSTASISDTSSVHSYPPAPRPRTGTVGSRGSSAEGSADNWKAWASGMGNGKRRQSSDGWSYGESSNRSPAFVAASRRGSAVSFAPSARTPLVLGNPFAPLRKRLTRSIGTGKSVAVELQLIVELVDALDHYIQTFATVTSTSEAASQIPDNGLEVINEVSTLIRELVEIAPDAQRCLFDGAYGPFNGPSTSGAQLRTNTLYDNGLATWWPKRLVRDCRGVLDEIKISSRMAAASRLPTLKDGEAGEMHSENDDVDGVEWTLTRVDEGGGATPKEPKISAERREKLLEEGKKRWEAYRERQGLVSEVEEENGRDAE